MKDFRHEFKYILDENMASILENYLGKVGLRRDASQGGSYPVTSLYFDTPLLEDYYDKLSGLKFRKKLRARTYSIDFDDDMKVWLEVKEKHDMNISKVRSDIFSSDWRKFFDTDANFNIKNICQNKKDLQKFQYLFLIKNYRPNIVVKYHREAFVDNYLSGIRFTIDSSLETCKWRNFVDNINMTPVCKGSIILEAKFKYAMPWWFRDMVRRFSFSRQAFSKYSHSIDALNKYHSIPR